MTYYAKENVVFNKYGDVVCVVSPVWLLKAVANRMARMISDAMNETEQDDRDVLRGSLD